MGRIRALIIGAAVAFLVSGLLESSNKPDGGFDLDGLLTMAFLVYIWYTLRWAVSPKKPQSPRQKPESREEQTPPQPTEAGRESGSKSDDPDLLSSSSKGKPSHPAATPPGEPQPDLFGQNRAQKDSVEPVPNILGSLRREATSIVFHKPPWAIVERGETIGRFRNTPIPAWIRTSDNRQADYHGITADPLLDGTVCTEIPERSELILPPGLVFLLRT